MEQLATPGSIRLTAETLKLAESYVQVRPLGPIPVKGLAEPLEIFELIGAGSARTRLQAAAARGFTRFVGRDAEMEQLRQAAEQARHERGQVVAVVGEPGVGKSRIFYEFIHSHRTHDWLVLESASVSYGKAAGFLPLRDLLTTRYYPVALRRPPADLRDRKELFVATSCRSRRARFTELLSGKARATSGSKRTRFVPAVARW